jgi:hypothetical protein
MKIIYVNGYTQDELLAIRETVRENIMKSMKSLLSAANQRGLMKFILKLRFQIKTRK